MSAHDDSVPRDRDPEERREDAADEARAAGETASHDDEELPALTADEMRRLHELEHENARLHDQMQRAAADIQGMRMRQARDREELRIKAIEAVTLDLLPVLDNLSLALDAHDAQAAGTAPSGSGDAVVEGVQMVRGLFVDALRRHGVEEIAAEGQPFDPKMHEAVGVVPPPDATTAPNTVVQVAQKGYRIGDRVLRASRVLVAGEGAPASDAGGRG